MSFPFAGGVAVVTGAAGGIGRSLAHRFARDAMRLVIADVDEAALGAVRDELVSAGADVEALRVDVSDAADVQRLADAACKRFGTVSILCNNAGIVVGGRARAIWEYDVEDWRWSLDVNVMSIAHGLRSFIPRMIAQGDRAHVVNTASIAGLVTGAHNPVYSMTKHAVVRASEALQASLIERGHPIGVTCLCPGIVRTRIYHSERNRPAALTPAGGPPQDSAELLAAAEIGMEPDQVADITRDAIIENRFYALTSDAFDGMIRARFEAILSRRNPVYENPLGVARNAAATR
ncbi:SDR family NAD(P)-dependent oxidoreductase [Terrarubrum flagellatum]|uniref:SDR family NAD(P)-dependent oxidoreductase n=1 Tax=Terrirubrum flagellatum TaxID=2895980 RepID=UPI0031455CD9